MLLRSCIVTSAEGGVDWVQKGGLDQIKFKVGGSDPNIGCVGGLAELPNNCTEEGHDFNPHHRCTDQLYRQSKLRSVKGV